MRPLVERLRGWDDGAERAAMTAQFEQDVDRNVTVAGRWAGGVVPHAWQIAPF